MIFMELLFKRAVRPQRAFESVSGQPSLGPGIALEVGIPESRRTQPDKLLEHLILLSASHPAASGENHVVAVFERDEKLVCAIGVIERQTPLLGFGLANGTGIPGARHVQTGNLDA